MTTIFGKPKKSNGIMPEESGRSDMEALRDGAAWSSGQAPAYRELGLLEMLRLVGLKELIGASNTYLHMPTLESRERCKSTWGTVGVVSALLAGLSIIPPLTAQGTVGLDSKTDAWQNGWLVALLYVSVLAFMCNITVIIMSTLFYIFIDHVLINEHLEDYLKDFVVALYALPIIFAVSILLVVVEIVVVVGYTCHSAHLWVLIGIVAGICCLLIALTVVIASWSARKCANLHFQKHRGPDWAAKALKGI